MDESPLVIFDLDGTIYESEHSVVPAMQETCREFGLREPSPRRILELLALTTDEQLPYISEGREDIDLQAFVTRMEEREFSLVRKHAKPFDGVLEVLRKLKADNFTLAVCSSGSMPYVNLVIDSLGIREWFSAVSGTKDKRPKHKRAVEIARHHQGPVAAVVGDAASDARAAHAIDAPFVIAAYGYSLSSIGTQTWNNALRAETPAEIPEKVQESLLRSSDVRL